MSNPVPYGWKIELLENITTLCTAKSVKNDEYPVLTSSRSGLVLQSEYFKKRVTSSDNTGYKVVAPGEFTFRAMSDDGTFKFNRSLLNYKGIVSPAYEVFRSKDFPSDFLDYLLSSEGFLRQIYASAQGGTRLALKYKSLSRFSVTIPESSVEQKKIAAILSTVDEVIEKTRAQIDKLKDLKTGMMQELLTKGIGHTEFKDSPVGRIPVGWDVCSLKEVTRRIRDGNYGLDYPKASEMLESGVPFLTSTVIGKDHDIDESKLRFISKLKHQQLSKAHIETDDVLFTNRGASVGNVALVPENLHDANIGPQLTLLRVDSGRLCSKFLYFSLQTNYFRNQLRQLDSGSAMNFFGIGTTEQFHISVPPLEEQAEIVDILMSVAVRVRALGKKLSALNSTKKALMQDLLTGKVRVNIDNKESAVA